MRIQHNIAALNSYRQLNTNNNAVAKNLEKLSSGYRINRAGDDAAGLAISEKMRAQIKGLETAEKNANDGISLIQTAEGNLQEVHSMLNRMVELATQSANGTYQNTNRNELQKEIKNLTDEIDRISKSANFNGIKLLDGSLESKADQVVNGTAGSQSINNGIEVGKSVDGYGVTGEFTIDVAGTFGDGDSITITGTKGDGTAFTAKDYGTVTGDRAAAGEIKVHFGGADGITSTTKEGQANDLYQRLLTNDELTSAFDISVSGTKVTLKAKQEGAPSITGGGPQGIGNITNVTTNNKNIGISNNSTDVAASARPGTDANGLPLNAEKLRNAGVTGLVTPTTDHQVGDILEFKFKLNGADVSAKVELTEEMFQNGGLDTEQGTELIAAALRDAKFSDDAATNIDESKYKVGDYINVTANKNAKGFSEAGSLMIEGKSAGALTFEGVTKNGTNVGTSAAGKAGTNGTVETTGAGATAVVTFAGGLTLTADQLKAGLKLTLNAAGDGIQLLEADETATAGKTFTQGELAGLLADKIGTEFKGDADGDVWRLTGVDTGVGTMTLEKVGAATGNTLVDETNGITATNFKFVDNSDASVATGAAVGSLTTSTAGTPGTAVAGTATFKVGAGGITGRNVANALELTIGGGTQKLVLVAANAGQTAYTQDEILKLLADKIGAAGLQDNSANATWEIDSIASDGTVTLKNTSAAANSPEAKLSANTAKLTAGAELMDMSTSVTTAAGISAGNVTANTTNAASRYHSKTEFGTTGDNATNFSLGDKFSLSGVLSDGTKFDIEMVAGKHFTIGATKEDTLDNIKTALLAGQNGTGTDLTAVNAKLTSTNGEHTTTKDVATSTIFGSAADGKEFDIFANDDVFADATGNKGDFIISSNKAGQVASTAEGGSIVGTSGGAVQVSVTPLEEANFQFAGSAGSAQTGARTSITFKEGMEYGSAFTFGGVADADGVVTGGKTYEFVADAADVSDPNNTAIVISDLANARPEDIANAVKDALANDFGDTYNFESIGGKLNISSKEVGSTVAAPELKLMNGTEIKTASYKFDPKDVKVGKQFNLNGKMVDGKLEGGQTFEFYQKGAAPVEPKEGVKYVAIDFTDPVPLDSKKIADAVAEAVENDESISSKMSVTVADDGTMTVSSKVVSDGKYEDGSFTMTVDGEGGGLRLQIGETNEDFQKVTVSIGNMNAASLGLGDINIGNQDDAGKAIDLINSAIDQVSSQRGDLGALQNRLDHTINNIGVTTENMTAAESRIRDVDMAKEMMEFTKNNILTQAAQAMLAQANTLPQGVLQLLQ